MTRANPTWARKRRERRGLSRSAPKARLPTMPPRAEVREARARERTLKYVPLNVPLTAM